MRCLISFLLFLCVFASGTYANRAIKVKRFDLLRDAVSKMVPELTGKMALEHGGVAMDEFVEYLSIYEPRVYNLYSERGLRIALGKVLNKELEGDVFSLLIDADGKKISKYFLGVKPNLINIISNVIADLELRAEMEGENGELELSAEEITPEVIESYPEVHTLYMQASQTKTDHGLRVALGQAMGAVDGVVVVGNRYVWRK